jgi:RNA polymerase subunit RPABC4/transcription elongation factor Spt4
LRLDSRYCKLCLDEGETDSWFLLIVGAKLDLRGSCICDSLTIEENQKRGQQ